MMKDFGFGEVVGIFVRCLLKIKVQMPHCEAFEKCEQMSLRILCVNCMVRLFGGVFGVWFIWCLLMVVSLLL